WELARGHRPMHEPRDRIRTATSLVAAWVEGLPGSSASHLVIAQSVCGFKSSVAGERDHRAIDSCCGRDPARTNSALGEVDADDVPAESLLPRAACTSTRDEQGTAEK